MSVSARVIAGHSDHSCRHSRHSTQRCNGAGGASAGSATVHWRRREHEPNAVRGGGQFRATASGGAGLPRLLPVDPRGPAAVARHGGHARRGGGRAPVRAQAPRRRGRGPPVRGALRPAAVLPDAGRVHAVGHPAAAPPLPRPRPGPRPHVRL
uniref:Uncharacterized protein n=1 Tax=Zea mays TaxID=4577 RepID=B4FMW3_MAIZE|nr:unknown [Zea mays]